MTNLSAKAPDEAGVGERREPLRPARYGARDDCVLDSFGGQHSFRLVPIMGQEPGEIVPVVVSALNQRVGASSPPPTDDVRRAGTEASIRWLEERARQLRRTASDANYDNVRAQALIDAASALKGILVEQAKDAALSAQSPPPVVEEAGLDGVAAVVPVDRAAAANAGFVLGVPDITGPRLRKALEEALTPSADTKAAYIGEFSFTVPERDEDGHETYRRVLVPWDTTKEIMAAIRKRALASTPASSPPPITEEMVEKGAGALQAAWDASGSKRDEGLALPPIDFSLYEARYLATACLTAALASPEEGGKKNG